MTILQKILELLISQIGYTESGTNITKYAEYFDKSKAKGGAWQFFNTKKQGAEWCALLIIWAFCQVIGPDKTREFLGLPEPKNNCAAGCKYFYQYLKAKGYEVKKTEGQVGAIVFFNTSKAKCGHVGFIKAVDDKKYYTIEGNKSNKVKECSYVKNSTTIYAVCMPDYSKLENIDPNPEPQPTPAPEPTPAPQPQPAPAPSTQKYKVKTKTGVPLRLRAKPTTSSEILALIPNGTIIESSETQSGWAKTSYNGKSGWCSLSYLVKVG